MMGRDADADPVFAQDDLVDDLTVADVQWRHILFGELGKVGIGFLLAPGAEQTANDNERTAGIRSDVPGHFALPFRIEQIVVILGRFILGYEFGVVAEPDIAVSRRRPGAVDRDGLLWEFL